MKLNLKVAVSICLLAITGVAAAQITLNRATKENDGLDVTHWESTVQSAASIGDVGDSERIAKAYAQAAGNKEFTEAAVRVAFKWDTRAKPIDTSLLALQVLQNQKLIEQNQRIIQLLEQQKKVK